MTTITQEGEPVTAYVAHYMRYHAPCTYEADTLENAIGFLASGEDYGSLSAGQITDAEGNTVLDEREVMARIWALWDQD